MKKTQHMQDFKLRKHAEIEPFIDGVKALMKSDIEAEQTSLGDSARTVIQVKGEKTIISPPPEKQEHSPAGKADTKKRRFIPLEPDEEKKETRRFPKEHIRIRLPEG